MSDSEKTKPLLSIVIPTMPNRAYTLRALLSRLTLNMVQFPDHTFETIIIDGGATDDTKALCEYMQNYMPLKYVFCPIERFISPAYPINIGLRMCEGPVIGVLDPSLWPSESIIYGMLNPFVHDAKFRFHDFETSKDYELKEVALNNLWKLNGQYEEAALNVLNISYVPSSNESGLCEGRDVVQAAQQINELLLKDENLNWEMLDVFKQAKLSAPDAIVTNDYKNWAMRREEVLQLRGYDEKYCLGCGFEHGDWKFRVLTKLGSGEEYRNWNNFCGIHLWHPTEHKNIASASVNAAYFGQADDRAYRNIGFHWGKLLKYSFSIIDGMARDPVSHERWIREHIKDVPSYVEEPQWPSLDEYLIQVNKL